MARDIKCDCSCVQGFNAKESRLYFDKILSFVFCSHNIFFLSLDKPSAYAMNEL